MGSRGSGSGSQMNVPFDKWGREVNDEPVYDKEGNTVGYISDELRSITEEYTEEVTKKQVLEDIDAWRMDDGTYGDDDVAIYLAYKDGTFVDVKDLNGKAYKKTGIIGASISTGDYQMVWGGEITKNGDFVEWQTWSPDGESGESNSISGYKTVGVYRQRVKTTFNNPNGRGGYKTKREVLRKSKVKKVE